MIPHYVKKLGIILEPTMLSFERQAVLNPGCIQEGEFVHLFYRAIDGEGRSSIGYAKLHGPTTVVERSVKPLMTPDFEYESQGVEDPRLTKIEDTYYMTYVAHDGKNALTAYAISHDLKQFEKKGLLSPRITYHDVAQYFRESQLKDAYYLFESFYEEGAGKDVYLWHKDVILFPKKILNQFVLIHRVLPDIQILFFEDFSKLTNEFWINYFKQLGEYVILENKHWFETRHIGGGAPPIETNDGWLLVLHAAEETNRGRVYRAGAALLDKEKPWRVIGKLHEPLFGPTEPWEVGGRGELVRNVVFPTGTALFGDRLYVYYGAADTRIAVAEVDMPLLLQELKHPRHKHESP